MVAVIQKLTDHGLMLNQQDGPTIAKNMDSCRLCGSGRQSVILAGLKDHFGDKYDLKQCAGCGFVGLSPLPALTVLDKIYRSHYWNGKKPDRSQSILETLFHLRMMGLVKQLRHILPSDAVILDWGAGNGQLVRLLRKKKFQAFGIDPYAKDGRATFISQKSIHDAALDQVRFDAVLAFHVIEHLFDPVESIRSASKILNRGGRLIIEVPNIDSFQYRLRGKKWQPLEVPAHMNHFSPRSLRYLLEEKAPFRIDRFSFFSPRVSTSALVLSLSPFFSPQKVRRRWGYYPFVLKLLYLLCQLLLLPFAAAEAAVKRGGIMRIYATKVEC